MGDIQDEAYDIGAVGYRENRIECSDDQIVKGDFGVGDKQIIGLLKGK